jgi:hypothetical protein
MRTWTQTFGRFVIPALMAAGFAQAHAEGPTHRNGAARLSIGAQVAPTVRLRILSALHSLSLSTEAASQALLNVAQAASVEIFSNQTAYELRFDIVDADVLEVEVEGLEMPVRVGPGGRSIMVSRAEGAGNLSRRNFSYRVRYAPGVIAGQRPIPVRISVQNT